MDERKQELQRLKKACRKSKRGYVTGWKTVSVIMLVLALIFAPLSFAAKTFDNAVAAVFGGSFWELVDADETAKYFSVDYDSREELDNHSKKLAAHIMTDGAVLLKNVEQALPLQHGAVVSCFTAPVQNRQAADQLNNALEQAGFAVNRELCALAQDGAGADELLQAVSAHGDTAIVFLSAEFADEQNTVSLLQGLAEQKLAGQIKKIIIMLSQPDIVLPAYLQDAADGVLWVGNVATGADGIGELLSGKVSPSGRLPVTCSRSAERQSNENTVCLEGIYAGYKYFETRYEDFVTGTGNPGDYRYGEAVAYPFGFGLSYTDFSYSDLQVVYNEKADRFEVTVTVTNTGKAAGKETVQIYAQAPYTEYDKTYSVEKASVNLVGFAKTDLLEPGENTILTVYVDKRDLASYDAYGAGTYILDEGYYFLTVASDAHQAVNNILAAKGYTPESTQGRMDESGNSANTWQWIQNAFDKTTYAVSADGAVISNQLSFADPGLCPGVEQTVSWLSRRDWEGTLGQTAISIEPPMTKVYDPQLYPVSVMPTLGAQNGLKLWNMIGLGFDDIRWQTLLDQLTIPDMLAIIADSYYGSMPAASVDAPGTRYENATGQWPLLLSAFDRDLSYQAGRLIGNSCLANGRTDLYGPDSGFTEDGYLAGRICASQVLGIREKGIRVAVRLFTKDMPEDGVWLREQAARERYLRPAQYALTAGSADGTALGGTRLGAQWVGAAEGLLNRILRDEWGSRGIAVVYEPEAPTVTGVEGVMAGVTAYHAIMPHISRELAEYADDPVVVSAMREACHYHLYTLVNSAAMNGIGQDTRVEPCVLPVVVLCRAIGVCSGILFVIFGFMWCRGSRIWKKSQSYLDYKTMRSTLKEEKKTKK